MVLAVALTLYPYQGEFESVAGGRAIDRAAQAWQESRFNPLAENPYSHAKGLAQFMDATWREMKSDGVVPQDASPFDPHWAIVAQHAYMRRQEAFARRTVPGIDPWLGGLACYNWGPGNWKRAVGRAERAGARGTMAWVRFSPRETQDYIRLIPARAEHYRRP
jgi:membrane-bound lytic murein transglycosylase MltF